MWNFCEATTFFSFSFLTPAIFTWLSTPPPFILPHPPTPPSGWQRPYKVMAARPHRAAPAGWAGEPRPAAWSSFAGAERTGRGRAPSWPTTRRRRREVPPQTAGSSGVWPAGPGRQGNDLERRENREVVCSGAPTRWSCLFSCVGFTWVEQVGFVPVLGVVVNRPHVDQNTSPTTDRVTSNTRRESCNYRLSSLLINLLVIFSMPVACFIWSILQNLKIFTFLSKKGSNLTFEKLETWNEIWHN